MDSLTKRLQETLGMEPPATRSTMLIPQATPMLELSARPTASLPLTQFPGPWQILKSPQSHTHLCKTLRLHLQKPDYQVVVQLESSSFLYHSLYCIYIPIPLCHEIYYLLWPTPNIYQSASTGRTHIVPNSVLNRNQIRVETGFWDGDL